MKRGDSGGCVVFIYMSSGLAIWQMDSCRKADACVSVQQQKIVIRPFSAVLSILPCRRADAAWSLIYSLDAVDDGPPGERGGNTCMPSGPDRAPDLPQSDP